MGGGMAAVKTMVMRRLGIGKRKKSTSPVLKNGRRRKPYTQAGIKENQPRG